MDTRPGQPMGGLPPQMPGLAAGALAADPAPMHARPARCLALIAVYGVCVGTLLPTVGPPVMLLSIIPVALSGWWSGALGGAMSWSLVTTLHIALSVAFGQAELLGSFAFVAIHGTSAAGAFAAGRISALLRELRTAGRILDSASIAILVVDRADGTVVQANTSAQQLLGRLGRSVGVPVSEWTDGQCWADLHGAAAASEGLQTQVRAASGAAIPVHVSARDVCDDGVELSILSIYDRTAEVALEDRLVAAERSRGAALAETQLHRANRLAQVGTVSASVGHEINNPLTYVLVNLMEVVDDLLPELREAIRDGESAETCEEIIQEIEHLVCETRTGGERIKHIVADLRIFARASDDEISLEPVDLDELSSTAARMTRHNMGPQVCFEHFHDGEGRVLADAGRLSQVVINLLTNAAHAVQGRRRPRIHLRTEIHEDMAVIEVEDTGCGMDADTQARVFEPFFTTKPIGEGTGIGLSVCRSIVEAMGGTLTLQSEVGVGSTFRIEVPRGEVQVDPSSPPEVLQGGTPEPLSVLVVDDEPLVGRSVAHLLRGWDVTVAGSGAEALRLMAACRFDLVLSDLLMPEMTGMQLYQHVLATDPEQASRFVFATGGAATLEARVFTTAHADRVLAKPLGPELAGRLAAIANAPKPTSSHPVECPKAPYCPMFPHFSSVAELGIYQRVYCGSCDGAHTRCARLLTLQRTGQRPPPWLMPDGGRLSTDAPEVAA